MDKSEIKRQEEKKCIVKIVGILILLITAISFIVISHFSQVSWDEAVQESSKEFKYETFNKKEIAKLDSEIQEFYKSARILYGNSNLEHSLIESYSLSGRSTYGWDSSYSSRLIDAMDSVIGYIDGLGFETSFSNKEKEKVIESLQMIRYFCNNQQLINKVRLKMNLIGNYQGMDNSIDILLIDEGGAEFLKDYDVKLKRIKEIFK